MAYEAPIQVVEIVQFAPTKQCLTDPSVFKTIRDIVERWQEKGMKGQYWGPTVEKPINMYWVIFWQSRAHAAAFAADPLYTEFVHRRQSLATTLVRDLHVAMSGTPRLWVKAPFTEVAISKLHDTHMMVEEGHEITLTAMRRIQSMQPPGFFGSGYGVADEDPTVGVYIVGWNSVEDHLRLGMGEGRENEKIKEESEKAFQNFSELTLTHIAFKKHSS